MAETYNDPSQELEYQYSEAIKSQDQQPEQTAGKDAAKERAKALTEKIKTRNADIKAAEAKPVIDVGLKNGKTEQVINTPELEAVKRENPELYTTLKDKGIDAFMKKQYADIGRQRFVASQEAKRQKDTAPAVTEAKYTAPPGTTFSEIREDIASGKPLKESQNVKAIWRSFTPWDEEQETFADYAKGWPKRFAENFKPKQESQLKLKNEYEQQQSAPMWAKMLSSSRVFKDNKTGNYYRVLISEGPASGKSKAAAAAKRAVKTLEKVDYKKVEEAVRAAKAKQAVDAAKKALGKEKWKDIEAAISRGKEKAAISAARAREAARSSRYTPSAREVARQRAEESISEALRRELGAQVAAEYAQRIKAASSPVVTARFQRIITVLPTQRMQRQAAVDMALNPASAPMWSAAAKAAEVVGEKASTRQKEKAAIQAMAAPLAVQAVETSLQTGTDPATSLQTQTELLTDPAVRNPVKTALRQPNVTKLTSRPPSPPSGGTPRPPRVGSPKPPAIRKIPFPAGGSDKQEREIVESSEGAIAWRQGQVAGKDRWDVIIHPYRSDSDGAIILGNPPEGATIVSRGKGSADATAQMIRGQKKPDKTVNVDSGFEDVKVTSGSGRKINLHFQPDPEGETKGDITLGRKQPSISKRTPRISRKMPRIR